MTFGRFLAAAGAAALLALAGCGPPLHYTLRPGATVLVLAPPLGDAAAKPRRLHLSLEPGAACEALRGGFDGQALFGFQWQLAQRHLQVGLGAQLSRFSQALPVNLLQGIQDLHATLESAVAAGCLAPLAGERLLQRVSESVPLAPDVAQRLLFGPYAMQDYIDIAGPVELDLTYAANPAQPGRYDLGWVEQIYALRVSGRTGRGQLRLLRTQVHGPQRPAPPPPVPMALPTGGQPMYLRLFFYLRFSSSNHDIALVAAHTRSALAAATRALLGQPDRCAHLQLAGVACQVTPADVGLEARLAVSVQGRPVAAPLPATVSMALEAAGVHDRSAILSTLRILRPFRGRLLPVEVVGDRNRLLQLVLSGGEQISW